MSLGYKADLEQAPRADILIRAASFAAGAARLLRGAIDARASVVVGQRAIGDR